MTKTLLIFVDSFPFDALSELPRLKEYPRWRVLSGIGFSINIKPHIFGGYTADDVGYFNEWMYTPTSRYRMHRHWLRLMQLSTVNYVVDRVIHRTLSKFLFQENVLNIPFKYLPYFARYGGTVYDNKFPLPTIFSRASSLKWIRYKDFPRGPHRDELVFGQATELIQRSDYDTFFIASADLDAMTHSVGVGSNQHWAKLKQLDSYIAQCLKVFFTRYPDGRFLFVSDHSMANVHSGVNLQPETVLGPATEDSYLYFVDATMVRFWIFDSSLRKPIEHYLQDISHGRILTDEERALYGVTTPEFADIIFLLDEGVMFRPTFWGRGLAKAMHGYHPDTNSQKGFLVANELVFEEEYIPTADELYKALCERICAR